METENQDHNNSIMKLIMGKLLHKFENNILNGDNDLYEELLVNMCYFVAMLPAEYFSHLVSSYY